MKKFIALSAALLLFVGCSSNTKAPQPSNTPESTQVTEEVVLGLGDSYICSEFEATLGDDIEWYDSDERTYFKVISKILGRIKIITILCTTLGMILKVIKFKCI